MKESDALYRLRVAICNGEVQRLAFAARVLHSARAYRPEWSHDDVVQELCAYLLHLQQNTNSGWDVARGKFSTWVTVAAKGWVCKLGRRQPEPVESDGGAPDRACPTGDPEQQMVAAQTARAHVR